MQVISASLEVASAAAAAARAAAALLLEAHPNVARDSAGPLLAHAREDELVALAHAWHAGQRGARMEGPSLAHTGLQPLPPRVAALPWGGGGDLARSRVLDTRVEYRVRTWRDLGLDDGGPLLAALEGWHLLRLLHHEARSELHVDGAHLRTGKVAARVHHGDRRATWMVAASGTWGCSLQPGASYTYT